jgi:hypothetical protein
VPGVPRLGEGRTGQWITQALPNQTGPGNTSSLAQTPALGPPLPQKHPSKLGIITPFESLYGCLFLISDLILDGETARLTSRITHLDKFNKS